MATHHTHHSGTYAGKKIDVLTTQASNVCLYNLSGKKTLTDSSYYGINGGFFSTNPISLAISDGTVISEDNGWAGACIITWNGIYFEKFQPAQELSAATRKTLNESGTWAQGGIAMRLGNTEWFAKALSDIDQTEDSIKSRDDLIDIYKNSRQRTALVVDTVSRNVFMFVTGMVVKNGSYVSETCSLAGMRAAIQEYLGIKDVRATDNTRYYGMFLDGGGSTQMKYRDGSKTTVIGGSRKLYQIVALRNDG